MIIKIKSINNKRLFEAIKSLYNSFLSNNPYSKKLLKKLRARSQVRERKNNNNFNIIGESSDNLYYRIDSSFIKTENSFLEKVTVSKIFL